MPGDESKQHWDAVYEKKGAADVSWYQPSHDLSLQFISDMKLPKSAGIIDVGGGASTLVDDLLATGFTDLAVLDLSGAALALSKERLGVAGAGVTWLEGDVTKLVLPDGRYDVWHDRAVFHFLTSDEARRQYVALAHRALKPGGHIVVATFGTHGPEQCSGLDVVRYDPDGLRAEFGAPFEKVRHETESHKTPWGSEQEFVYCYCRRT